MEKAKVAQRNWIMQGEVTINLGIYKVLCWYQPIKNARLCVLPFGTRLQGLEVAEQQMTVVLTLKLVLQCRGRTDRAFEFTMHEG
jgi:hypothetical protein